MGIRSFEGGKFGGGAFDRRAEFIDVVENLKSDLADEIAAVGNDAEEPLVLQAHRGFTYRSPAALIAFGKIFFAERFAGLVNAVDDVALEGAIDFLAESRGGARNGGPRGLKRRRSRALAPRKPVARYRLRQETSRIPPGSGSIVP